MPRDELHVGPSGALTVVQVYSEDEIALQLADAEALTSKPYVPPETAAEAIANERADGDADPEGTARLNHPALFAGKGDHDNNGKVGGAHAPVPAKRGKRR